MEFFVWCRRLPRPRSSCSGLDLPSLMVMCPVRHSPPCFLDSSVVPLALSFSLLTALETELEELRSHLGQVLVFYQGSWLLSGGTFE
jgi:hypothetical protein